MTGETDLEFAGGDLILRVEGSVARLTLNRPERRNALGAAMWRGLGEAARAADSDPRVKVMVVCGAGGHFAAGADIAEFEAVAKDREAANAFADAVHDGVGALAQMEKPTLAMIEGFCVGGGVAVALACDIQMAADDAQLGVTPAKLGLVYNIRDTRLLVDAVGPSMARDLLYTGRLIGAAEALAIGLVDFVHPSGDLAGAVESKTRLICANAQTSAQQAKTMVRRALEGQSADDEVTREVTLQAFLGPEFAEGRTAFMAKRPPKFR